MPVHSVYSLQDTIEWPPILANWPHLATARPMPRRMLLTPHRLYEFFLRLGHNPFILWFTDFFHKINKLDEENIKISSCLGAFIFLALKMSKEKFKRVNEKNN